MENKNSKYFKYAIGEIVLVVIGILIALQINNWNQELQNNDKEVYFLEEMLKEFTNNKKLLERFVVLTEMKSERGRDVKKTLQRKKTNKDSLLSNLFFNGKSLIFRSFTPIYDEMVSSGQTGLIKNDSVKYLIKDYKDYIGVLEDFIYKESATIKDKYNFHLYKHFDHEIMTLLWKWGQGNIKQTPTQLAKGLKQDFEGFKKDPESYYYVSMNIGTDTELNRAYKESLIPRLDKVLIALKNELKHD